VYKKILVAVDFSKYSEKIIDCVGDIPGVKEVLLLNILTRDPLARVWSPGDEEKAASKKLEAYKAPLEKAGLAVSTRVNEAESGLEYQAISRAAEEENADLVVMGARGRGIWKGLLLGSVSSAYLRYGSKDLLIMRYKTIGSEEMAELEKHCAHIFDKVLCPVDFSAAGNAAIERIKETKLTKNVLLLNVVARGESPAQVEALQKEADSKLDLIKADLALAGINAAASSISAAAEGPRTYGSGGMVAVKATPLVSIGGVVETILSVAEGEDVSLIAMGSHGKGWLEQAAIGSVVSDVARMGARPVLVVRSRK
jgi:nucleotide-binding universal stress UspA family protein